MEVQRGEMKKGGSVKEERNVAGREKRTWWRVGC